MAFTLPDGVFKVKTANGYEYYQQEDNKLTYISPGDAQARFGTVYPLDYVNENAPNTDPQQLISQFGISGLSNLPANTELAQSQKDYAAGESKQGSVGGPTGGGTTGSGTSGSSGSSGSTGATGGGYTRDAQGNVFDSSGKHLLLADIPKGANGKPSINLETLPVGQYTLDAQGGSVNSGTGQPTWADQKAIDGLKFQFGWTDEQAKQFIASDPNQAKQWALTGEYLKNQADLSQAKTATNAQELAAAHQKALAELDDPNSSLGQKYQDLDKTNVANFNTNLEAIRTATSTEQAQRQIDFNNQRLAQANAAAASGTAYSGFRERAKQELGTQQSGIVQSSLATLKQNLQSQFQPLEQYYGSKQFANLFGNTGVNFQDPTTGQSQNIAYNQVGNLTGTQKSQKEADVASETQNLYGATATT